MERQDGQEQNNQAENPNAEGWSIDSSNTSDTTDSRPEDHAEDTQDQADGIKFTVGGGKSSEYKKAQDKMDPTSEETLKKIFRDNGFSEEFVEKADGIKFWQGYMKDKNGDPLITDPMLSVTYSGMNKKAPTYVEPVVPAIIKPSKNKPVKRNHKVLFVFGDAQIGYRRVDGRMLPIHDERAIDSSLALAKWINPDYDVNIGDHLDLAEISHFPKDSDHFEGTLQPTIQRGSDVLAEFTANTPNAVRKYIEGNHEARLAKYVLQYAFPLYNLKQAKLSAALEEMEKKQAKHHNKKNKSKEGPIDVKRDIKISKHAKTKEKMNNFMRFNDNESVMSFSHLMRTDEVGWDYISGYPNAGYEYKPDLVFTHGVHAGMSAAHQLAAENPDRNIVQGHVHHLISETHTDRRGRYMAAMVIGTLCSNMGMVPSIGSSVNEQNQPMKRYEDWQNSVMVIHDYGKGHYEFENVMIQQDGKIYYQGKVFG